MARHNNAIHIHLRSKKKITFFDRVIFVCSFLYPMSGIPQIVEVFNGNAEGVSLVAWMSFTGFALLFFIYGFKHRIIPVMISNGLWFIVEALVTIGALMSGARL